MNKKSLYILLPVGTGLLVFISAGTINFYTGWFAFVPLFACIVNTSSKKSFKLGLLSGAAFSCFAYSWMITGAQRFTGYSFIYGAGIMLLCMAFTALYWGGVVYCFSLLQKRLIGITAALLNSIIAASVFCLFEFLLSYVAAGFPWFSFYAGNSLVAQLYAIQPAALFGPAVLSFIVIVVNYLIAAFILEKQWLRLSIPVIVFIVYMVCGYLVFSNFHFNKKPAKPVTIALINENILPDIKWDDTNGDLLVQRLLQLDEAAAAQRPDIIVWSESAIPWTYSKDDDLVNELLKIAAPAKASQILGINTAVQDNIVNNSAYAIQPDGSVTGRYDKQFLLSLIEAPFMQLNIPFFSSKGYTVDADKDHALPLQTPYGKAGIIICNESTSSSPARHAVNNDAQFLCNLSNDGWFNQTYMVRHHFYQARLRAVETRKAIAVNANNGYSGFINADGVIMQQRKAADPFVIKETVYLNNYKSLAVQYPYLLVSACAIFLLAVTIFNLFKKNHL